MATSAFILTWIALAGALASWIAGAVFFARTLAATGDSRLRWYAVVAWPFARGRLEGAAAEHAARVNKALVAFFACLMIAAAAWSVASNLNRLAR
jgi:hypothetical protein